MNLQYLQSFYMAVKCNSMSKAAAALHLTQPGLSMQIKNLENDLGASLLIRSNKGVELTEEGKVVFNYADTLLSIKGNIERDIKGLQQDNPKLIIGSCKSVGEYALPCSLYIFKRLYRELDISIEIVNSSQVVEKLCNHSINLGIIQDDCKECSITTKHITSDEMILVGHDNDYKGIITIEELKELPLILREKSSNARYLVEKVLQAKGVSVDELNVIYSLNSPEAIKTSVSAGKGFAFLPKLIVQNELRKGSLKHIEVEGISIKFDYNIAYRKNYEFNKYEQMFVDFILSSKRGFC